MSNGRSIFQPESTFGRFDDENMEQFLHNFQSQVAKEVDNVYNVLGDARNITIAIPGYNDNLEEAVQSSVQEALFPILTQGQASLIPQKSIVAYAGTMAEARVIRGWGVCDGTVENGLVKPDLRHKFLRGAGIEADAGLSGGLELTNVQVAPHNDHVVTDNLTTEASADYCAVEECAGGVEVSVRAHTHTLNGDVTVDAHSAHSETQSDNKPPYYEVIWLIKL